MAKPVTLAAIDAGSNAIRMIIATATGDGFRPVVKERVPVRLGHHTFVHGELDGKTIEQAVTAFSRFHRLFEEHGVQHYRAVATSAVRSANNGEDLIDRLYREIGLELEVIDGLEEARLVRKAVERALGDSTSLELVVDLGGGSLEISSRSKDVWKPATMRIGTVRLLETFGLSGALSDDEARLIRRYVSSQLRANLDPSTVSADMAIACGGNAEALADLFGQEGKAGLMVLKKSQLEGGLPKVLAADVKRRMSRYNVRKDRAEVMGVAAIVLAEVAEFLSLKRYTIPGVGIREGVLLDLCDALIGSLDDSGDDPIAVASARAFAARLRHNTAHGEQVRRIASLLWSELKPLHKLPDSTLTVLQVAALLHDLGEVIHRRSHHKHSEYLVLNGRIPGLESPSREMAAAVARAHRKSEPAGPKHATFAVLDSTQQEHVVKLAAILRIADGLDSDHRQQIRAIRATVEDKRVVLDVTVDQRGADFFTKDSPKLAAFEHAFDRHLEVSVAEAATPTDAAPIVPA